MNAPTISTDGLERIAFATSFDSRSDQPRWTELAVYFIPPDQRPARNPNRAFLSESWGRTLVKGEQEFHRQRRVRSIEEALKLFDNSKLADKIVEQCQDWADRNPTLIATDPSPSIRFDGAGGLRGAIVWLYPDRSAEDSDSALAKPLAEDFGVPERTVRHTLAQERDGSALPSWCLAFLGALQHFDRDAFHAMRRAS